MEFAGAEGIKNSILYIFRTCEFHSGGLNVPLLGTRSTDTSSQRKEEEQKLSNERWEEEELVPVKRLVQSEAEPLHRDVKSYQRVQIALATTVPSFSREQGTNAGMTQLQMMPLPLPMTSSTTLLMTLPMAKVLHLSYN
jgi:hypothetical protein